MSPLHRYVSFASPVIIVAQMGTQQGNTVADILLSTEFTEPCNTEKSL